MASFRKRRFASMPHANHLHGPHIRIFACSWEKAREGPKQQVRLNLEFRVYRVPAQAWESPCESAKPANRLTIVTYLCRKSGALAAAASLPAPKAIAAALAGQ